MHKKGCAFLTPPPGGGDLLPWGEKWLHKKFREHLFSGPSSNAIKVQTTFSTPPPLDTRVSLCNTNIYRGVPREPRPDFCPGFYPFCRTPPHSL